MKYFKKNNFILFVCFLLLTFIYTAESKENGYRKFYFSSGAGYNFSFNEFPSGHITDHLIYYSDNSMNIQIPSIKYFFSEHWGVYCELNFGFPNSNNGEFNKFRNIIETAYSDDYYTNITSMYDDSGEHFINVSLGMVYRIQGDYWVLMPSLGIDILSFQTKNLEFRLNEKGTNKIFTLNFDSGKQYMDVFTITPGVTFGINLNKIVFLNCSVGYSLRNIDLVYKEVLTDLYTRNTVTTSYDYSGILHCMSINAGIMIGF